MQQTVGLGASALTKAATRSSLDGPVELLSR